MVYFKHKYDQRREITLGWYDFLNSNPIGKTISKVGGSAIDYADKKVQNGFDKVEKKFDRMSESAQKVGTGLDNLHHNVKNVIQNRSIDRNQIVDGSKDIKDIKDG
jgi:hypothetical protein